MDPTTAPEQRDAAADLAEVFAGVARLAGRDWAVSEPSVLLGVMVDLERIQHLLDAAKIAVTQRLRASKVVVEEGWASTGDFLTAASGGTKGAGPGLVRLSERLDDLPATQAAVAAGWLSRAKATVITQKIIQLPADPRMRSEAEALLLSAARELDASDLAQSWPSVLAAIDPDGSILGSMLSLDKQEQAAHAARHLSFSPDGFGGVRIRGYATPEDAELVKATLQPLAKPSTGAPGSCGGDPTATGVHRRGSCPGAGCDHSGRDPRDHGARLWDALVEACQRLQSVDVLPEQHGAPVRLMVTTSLDALLADLDARGHLPGGTLPGGRAVSVETVKRMACDAQIVPAVLGSDGQPLDVGRASRLVTLAIWYALVLRDKHCAFPGCTRIPAACDAHHIVHWAEGGETSLANLVLLCRRHHTFIHRTPWRVQINAHTGLPEWIPPPGRPHPILLLPRPREPVLAMA